MVAITSSVLLLSLLGNAMIKDSDLRSWMNFKEEYRRNYNSPTEEYYRSKIFMDNLRTIENHNTKFDAGLVTWRMGVNKFTDLTALEFYSLNKCKPFKHDKEIDVEYFGPVNVSASEVDWNRAGYVTPVKDQGPCGSCWTFSATGAIEAQLFKKTQKLISLSEQNLLDCTSDNQYGNHGCNGGYMLSCYDYVAQYGLMTGQSYPYNAVQGQCRFSKSESVVNVQEYYTITQTEDALKEVVANYGPVAVAVCANGFQHYQGGVLDYDCHDITHAVLVVGYGEDQGKQYWLVKNSWGTGWGEQGYLRMSRNKNNQAEIASYASIPMV